MIAGLTWYELDRLVDEDPFALRNRAWEEIQQLRAENQRLRTEGMPAQLRADVHQERADQLAVDLMAFADNMHTMAGQYPDNAAARNAFQVAEQRARDMLTSDRARESGS